MSKMKKAMTKEEAGLLLDLIQSRPIITSKETNASSNKLKEEAWASLANEFNSKNVSHPRHIDQLKVKWDNMKKSARKRCQQIHMNNMTADGGKSQMIGHDDHILDRVTGLLTSTYTGSVGPFDGDEVSLPVETTPDLQESSVSPHSYNSVPICEAKERNVNESMKLRRFSGIRRTTEELQISKGKKMHCNCDDNGRRERNLAIARYYDAKTRKINVKIKLLQEKLSTSQP